MYDDWNYERLLGQLETLLDRGHRDRYLKIVNSGRGPRFPWMPELDTHLQLMREDVESRMDEETRAQFLYWLDQEEGQEERRRYQAFMQGILYEREHPGKWRL